jgi:large subunit ribosomal protein L22
VRIQAEKLRAVMERQNAAPEQLAQALATEAFPEKDALRAVNNWMTGRDHPRCKAPMVRKMADTLGVPVAEISKFTSMVRNHRGSPRKAKLLVDLIRGKSVEEAENLLTFTTKRAAVNLKRCLMAARTDAEAAQASYDRLFVSEARVDGGAIMKRFQPKDRGRAHSIHKPFSHLLVSVEERPAGAGRRRKR